MSHEVVRLANGRKRLSDGAAVPQNTPSAHVAHPHSHRVFSITELHIPCSTRLHQLKT